MPQARALRETLTCHRAGPAFAHCFELSADALLRAADFGEWLKAVSSLVHSIYPDVQARPLAASLP